MKIKEELKFEHIDKDALIKHSTEILRAWAALTQLIYKAPPHLSVKFDVDYNYGKMRGSDPVFGISYPLIGGDDDIFGYMREAVEDVDGTEFRKFLGLENG